jgi:FAD/FMN-containing dehydrogenase
MTNRERSLLKDLRAALTEPVIGPADSSYDEARAVFSPAIDRRPAAITQPVDAAEVAAVVGFARERELELAIRSGGHSSAGHGVSEGGIVLDLARLNELEIDSYARVALAQTGLRAGEVTLAAAGHGLAIPFGDAGPVGIGGLTLGGGIGYLVRKHGLTIDSLLAAELVTADGRVLQVDDRRHPDLFWAIRGGGGNFGVVTRFLYDLHPIDAVTGGMLMLPATPETIAAFVLAAEEAPDELSTIANIVPVDGRHVVMATLVYTGSGEAAERALAPFRSIASPIADLLRPMSYPEIYASENGGPPPLAVMRTLFVDAIDRDAAAQLLERLRESTAQTAVAQIRVLGGAMARIPAEETAFAHRTRRVMMNVAALYASPGEAPVHEAWVCEAAAALSRGGDAAYVNFLGDEGSGRVRAAYPGETWERLTEVKRRYDPGNLFHLNQNIPPAAMSSATKVAA